MRHLTRPSASATDIIISCVKGIRKAANRDALEGDLIRFVDGETDYSRKGQTGDLYLIAPWLKQSPQGGISSQVLRGLYGNQLQKKRKPARRYYDQLLLAAEDKCPYCGGIGRPRNVDHYLPLSHFPQFSVLPLNLVPCCRDCNMDGKGNKFALTADSQLLHPYLDKPSFFSDKWVYATISHEQDCIVRFFVNAPASWPSIDQQRVTHHFHIFDLAVRYAIQAAQELTTIISQRKVLMNCLPAADFSEYLKSIALSQLCVNHWKKVMFECLSVDEWFCNFRF